ncbi:MAG: AAA family ATPase, partial [Betaproteobacteria bacterium]|nr:AAA family ATPase [Betaproteobacteria bacterium]
MPNLAALKPEMLYHRCDPAQFDFDNTLELEDLTQIFGQARAAGSVEFATGIDREGYNLFVMGSAGSGKHTMVREHLASKVKGEPKPSDWAYINNFAQPHKALALELPAGRAVALRDDMALLVEELRGAIPAVFESDEYRTRAGQVEAEFNERHEQAFAQLGAEAAQQEIALLRTPAGFSFAPLKGGEVISAEEYAKLPEKDKERIEHVINALQGKLENVIRAMVQWRRERREKLKELNREMTLLAVGHLVAELKERHSALPKVLEYLDAVQQDVIDNAEDFRRAAETQPGIPGMPIAEPPSFRRYQVNVLVDHGDPDGSPVVLEDHPTYQNLIGRVEHIAQFGALVTDFALVKPGALHRANGGYLLLDVHKLLVQPFAWEGLKRALSTREIRIESLGEMYSLVSTVSLAPEPIPLNIKVVLFGDRRLYYLLHAYDPEFPKLFKVAADFEDEFDRTPANNLLFARLVATIARRNRLLPFDRFAVARVIEHGARMAGDARKLSADIRGIANLLCESDYWARQAGRERAAREDVERAIEAQVKRADRLRERVQERILRGTVMIDTTGARAGQVNGLSVFQLGDFAFAEPTRITATTRLGDGEVIDVQREVDLGGAIHSKGVL